MKDLSMKEKLDRVYLANIKLMECIGKLIENLDTLTARISELEDKGMLHGFNAGAGGSH
jgi:hypothetical protein